MRLLTFELADRNEAKACKNLNDVIRLNEKIEKTNLDNELKNGLLFELEWLKNDPFFINKKDINNYNKIDRVNYVLQKWTMVFIVKNNKYYFYINIKYIKKHDCFMVYLYNITDKTSKPIGSFDLRKGVIHNTENKSDRYIVSSFFHVVGNIIKGDLIIEDYVKTIKIKKGKVKARPLNKHEVSKVLRLVSSHVRSEHFRTLHDPRYYKNGVVPKDETQLRKIKIHETIVNRDVQRCQLTNK